MRMPTLARPLAAGAVVLVALAALTACGDDDSTANPNTGSASETSSSDSSTPSDSTSTASSADAASGCDYQDTGDAAKKVDLPSTTPDVSGTVTAKVTTNRGPLTFTLDADRAPCTVNSFVSLAKQGYFDNTSCHRLTTSGIYVLQCGDPTGTGTGGPGYTIPDELKGDESYTSGVLAMAKTAYPNSGGSQFFIVYGDSTALDQQPDYTIFGHVDAAGIKLVKKVAKGGTDGANGDPGDGHPKLKVEIEKVSVS